MEKRKKLAIALISLSITILTAFPSIHIVPPSFSVALPSAHATVSESSVMAVKIMIKPGSDGGPINPRSKGVIPVAVLSKPGTSSPETAFDLPFDAPNQVNLTSLTFGRTGDEQSLVFCGENEDVNGDGLPDLVCHFDTQKASFLVGDQQGILKGKLIDLTNIIGISAIIVPFRCLFGPDFFVTLDATSVSVPPLALGPWEARTTLTLTSRCSFQGIVALSIARAFMDPALGKILPGVSAQPLYLALVGGSTATSVLTVSYPVRPFPCGGTHENDCAIVTITAFEFFPSGPIAHSIELTVLIPGLI